MRYNNTCNDLSPETIRRDKTDFSKLKEVPENSVASVLFSIIDDIDTNFDVFKPEMLNFERSVINKIKKAKELIVSDGYKLYYTGGGKYENG